MKSLSMIQSMRDFSLGVAGGGSSGLKVHRLTGGKYNYADFSFNTQEEFNYYLENVGPDTIPLDAVVVIGTYEYNQWDSVPVKPYRWNGTELELLYTEELINTPAHNSGVINTNNLDFVTDQAAFFSAVAEEAREGYKVWSAEEKKIYTYTDCTWQSQYPFCGKNPYIFGTNGEQILEVTELENTTGLILLPKDCPHDADIRNYSGRDVAIGLLPDARWDWAPQTVNQSRDPKARHYCTSNFLPLSWSTDRVRFGFSKDGIKLLSVNNPALLDYHGLWEEPTFTDDTFNPYFHGIDDPSYKTIFTNQGDANAFHRHARCMLVPQYNGDTLGWLGSGTAHITNSNINRITLPQASWMATRIELTIINGKAGGTISLDIAGVGNAVYVLQPGDSVTLQVSEDGQSWAQLVHNLAPSVIQAALDSIPTQVATGLEPIEATFERRHRVVASTPIHNVINSESIAAWDPSVLALGTALGDTFRFELQGRLPSGTHWFFLDNAMMGNVETLGIDSAQLIYDYSCSRFDIPNITNGGQFNDRKASFFLRLTLRLVDFNIASPRFSAVLESCIEGQAYKTWVFANLFEPILATQILIFKCYAATDYPFGFAGATLEFIPGN